MPRLDLEEIGAKAEDENKGPKGYEVGYELFRSKMRTASEVGTTHPANVSTSPASATDCHGGETPSTREATMGHAGGPHVGNWPWRSPRVQRRFMALFDYT
jgi:hypothetical protein